jgi:hypothetical protein
MEVSNGHRTLTEKSLEKIAFEDRDGDYNKMERWRETGGEGRRLELRQGSVQ